MDGPLALQIKRSERKERRKLLPLHTTRPYVPLPEATRLVFNNKLLNNGIGGYSENGEEYIIHLPEKVSTPAPWVNVLANATFGTIVSESGQSYTWDTNAHEFRLTPWENDPVSDQGGETFYLRDEETGPLLVSHALCPVAGREIISAVTVSVTVFSNIPKTAFTRNCRFTSHSTTISNTPY